MISFPHCKINLGLRVHRKRSDGFHEISTCFYPIPWTDIVEIIESDRLEFTTSGLPVPGAANENLCLRAYSLLKQKFPLPPVKIHLHKIIPMGAGLGGGSADGAFVLRLLNEKFDLGLTISDLQQAAAQLGSDCAFFGQDKPKVGVGRGEQLEDVHVSLKGKYLVLVKPDVHVSTAEAYAGVVPALPAQEVRAIVEADVETWKDMLTNDFENSVLSKYPVIGKIKHALYEEGAVYASMSGSGSAVYGIFHEPRNLREKFSNHIYWSGNLIY